MSIPFYDLEYITLSHTPPEHEARSALYERIGEIGAPSIASMDPLRIPFVNACENTKLQQLLCRCVVCTGGELLCMAPGKLAEEALVVNANLSKVKEMVLGSRDRVPPINILVCQGFRRAREPKNFGLPCDGGSGQAE